MIFTIKGPLKENIYASIRRVGYYFQGKNGEQSELIFVRPPKGYPRFHIYLKMEKDNFIFNLHLDQKKSIYKGTPAHSGEEKGEVVENEAERIKQTLSDVKN